MAGTVNVVGFPSSQKTPGAYYAVVLGGPGTSAGSAPIRHLHFGNMIGSALTGSSPTFSVAAGTATTATVNQVFSASQSATLFGAGSELHLMALSAFAQDPNATLFQVATAQGTGQATGVLTFTGSQTAAVTCRVVVCGRFVDVAIAVGDSLTTIATNVATAINQQTNWPVTAQNSAGVVTISAKHVGLRGNNLTFRCFLISGAQTVKATAGALAATMLGLTATLSGGTAVGGVYKLSSGSTEETLTAALAAVASVRYNRYSLAQQGSTDLSAAVAQLNSMALVTTQLREQGVAASVDTYANAIALSGGQNAPRLQLVWHYNCDWTTGEIAAQVAAGRIAGDAAAGGVLVGEGTDPSANLDGLRLATIPAQDVVSDQPSPIQIEAALNNGLTVLQPTATGLTTLVRSITTAYKDGSGNPNYAVIDTEFVTVPDDVADEFQTDFALTFAGCKLGPDDPGGAAPKIANLVTPSIVRNRYAMKLKDREARGHIISVDAHMSQLVVVADSTTPGRLLADIPVVPAPALHQVGGNVRQLNS